MLLVEDAIKQVLVMAYKENTSQLEAQFIEQGFEQGYFILKMRLSVSKPYLQYRSA